MMNILNGGAYAAKTIVMGVHDYAGWSRELL